MHNSQNTAKIFVHIYVLHTAITMRYDKGTTKTATDQGDTRKGENDMTNAQIIFNNSIDLMEQGIIKGTGQMMKAIVTDKDGNEEEKMIEMPEEIHTYAAWKSRGYQVKRGEKAKAMIYIWKFRAGKEATEETEATEDKMFKTKAFFFTLDQVEKLA